MFCQIKLQSYQIYIVLAFQHSNQYLLTMALSAPSGNAQYPQYDNNKSTHNAQCCDKLSNSCFNSVQGIFIVYLNYLAPQSTWKYFQLIPFEFHPF